MFSLSPPPDCARGHLLSSFAPHLPQTASFVSSWRLPFCQLHALRVRNTITQRATLILFFLPTFPLLSSATTRACPQKFSVFLHWRRKGCECICMGEHGGLVECLRPVGVCEPSLSPMVRVNMGRGVHGRDLLQLREEVA